MNANVEDKQAGDQFTWQDCNSIVHAINSKQDSLGYSQSQLDILTSLITQVSSGKILTDVNYSANDKALVDTISNLTFTVSTKADKTTVSALDTRVTSLQSQIAGLTSGFKGYISPSDPAPSVDGIYSPRVSGTYVNEGGLVVDLNNQLVQLVRSGGVWVQIISPIALTGYVNKSTDISYNSSDQLFNNANVLGSGSYTPQANVSGYYTNIAISNTDGSIQTTGFTNWAVLNVPFGVNSQIHISGFLSRSAGHVWRLVDASGAIVGANFATVTGTEFTVSKTGSAFAVQFNFKAFDENLTQLLDTVMVNAGSTALPWVAYVPGNLVTGISGAKIMAEQTSTTAVVPAPTTPDNPTPKSYVDDLNTILTATPVSDFVNTPVVPQFTYSTSETGDVSISGITAPRLFDAALFGSVNPTLPIYFQFSSIRLFWVIGYKDATNICIVAMCTAGRLGRVLNLNLSTGATVVVSDSTNTALSGTDTGQIKISGDSILLYRNGALSKTLSIAALKSATTPANLDNIQLGICVQNISLTNPTIIVKSLIRNIPSSLKTTVSQLVSNSAVKSNITDKKGWLGGDSISDITAVYNGMYNGAYWWQLITAKYGATITSSAISGSSLGTPTIAGPVQLSDDTRLSTVTANGIPDFVIFFIGTNDFGARAVPLGAITDLATNKDTFYGALKYSLNYMCTNVPTAKIFIMTPLHRGESGFPEQQGSNPVRILSDYVLAIKNVAVLYGAEVIDTSQNSGLTYQNMQGSPYTGSDRLHPTPVGHQKIAAYVGSVINDRF